MMGEKTNFCYCVIKLKDINVPIIQHMGSRHDSNFHIDIVTSVYEHFQNMMKSKYNTDYLLCMFSYIENRK